MDSLIQSVKRTRNGFMPLVTLVKTWRQPALMWGASFGALAVYIIDWKAVCARIPFYNRKFEESAK